MGFLSKLFGGDSGAASGKSTNDPSSTPELESSVALRTPTRSGEGAPASTGTPAVSGDTAPASVGSAEDEPAREAAKAEPGTPATKADKPASSATRPDVRTPGAGSAPRSAPQSSTTAGAAQTKAPAGTAEPPASATGAAAATPASQASRSAGHPAAKNAEQKAPGAGREDARKAAEPRRAATLESSIITSAPVLPDAAQPAAAARGNDAAKPAKAAGEASSSRERAAAASGPLETSLVGRTRKDRSKSPGFYSNVAPPHAAHVVSHSHLKRAAVGGASGSGSSAAVESPEQGEPLSPRQAELAAPARPVGAEGDEKEDTSPGLGQARSRHDPASRRELPDVDLDLLVDFVMDLGLGLASDAWLTPVRQAVERLKAVAVKVQRNGLEKALAQLSVELDSSSALAEEKRARIIQQFVLVDLALPRPIDLPGQRLVRERLIVQHLLAELAASHPLIAQHLRDQGVSSLERLGRLAPEELSESAGVNLEHARQALAVFRDYLEERARRGPQLALLGKGALERRLTDLEISAEQFERLADGDDPAAKREARRQRQTDIARLSLFLAERGEAAVLSEIERCSVQGKIARLRRWLTEQPPSSVRPAGLDVARQEMTG